MYLQELPLVVSSGRQRDLLQVRNLLVYRQQRQDRFRVKRGRQERDYYQVMQNPTHY